MSDFRVKLGANDLNCVDLPLNPTHSLSVCTHCRESLGQIRAVLQRGLETIRLVGHGSLDVDLIVHLARTFAHRVITTAYDLYFLLLR